MKKIEITQDNFYLGTKSKFKGCRRPKRRPDYTSYGRDEVISSEYWYGENKNGKYVIRCSNHWSNSNKEEVYSCGKIVSCYWWLTTNCNNNIFYCGKAYFNDFSLN